MSSTSKQLETDIAQITTQMGRQARAAASALAKVGSAQKVDALLASAAAIRAQSAAILELSIPVLQVWKGILIMPLIGTIDTVRAAQMTERLLQEVAERQATAVLIDITGVAMVDSNVAMHILQTIQAVKLLGAECILTGVSPLIAQSMVTIGIPMEDILTKGSLYSGLEHALGHSKAK